MGKYLAIFRNSIQQTLIYRFNTFSYLTAQILSFGAFFYLWSSIYRQGGEIGGYTLAQLIFYYLGVNFLCLIFKDADIAWTVGDEIRLGNINTFLIQPISYFWRKFYSSLGRAVFRTIIALICFGFLVFILAHFNINFSFEWKNLILALISAMLGFLIDFLFFLHHWLNRFLDVLDNGFEFHYAEYNRVFGRSDHSAGPFAGLVCGLE